MPEQFTSLLTLGGLSAAVVAVLGILKRIPPGEEGTFQWKFAAWLAENVFFASIILAAFFGTLAWAVVTFLPGYQGQVQEFWEVIVLVWGVSQVFYNAQKGVARTFKK